MLSLQLHQGFIDLDFVRKFPLLGFKNVDIVLCQLLGRRRGRGHWSDLIFLVSSELAETEGLDTYYVKSANSGFRALQNYCSPKTMPK